METPELSSLPQAPLRFSLGFCHKKQQRIIPVFYPYAGCPGRCLFCAQAAQSGSPVLTEAAFLAGLPDRLRRPALSASSNPDAVPEVAFYGGTFTLLPRSTQQACLDMARQALGQACRVRCSTRPARFQGAAANPLDPAWLHGLREQGLHLVELGVQSFADQALARSGRGYTGDEAANGCRAVLGAGLGLGVQLMPGMPGVTPDIFLNDVRRALDLGASCLRLYPCLVFEGTDLARLWREGRYRPWDLPTTVRALGSALRLCWERKVPVIRMGLAPGPEMREALLDGPWHPALGSLAQAEALAQLVEEQNRQSPVRRLSLPKRCRGFFHAPEAGLAVRLAGLGLSRSDIGWHEGSDGLLWHG